MFGIKNPLNAGAILTGLCSFQSVLSCSMVHGEVLAQLPHMDVHVSAFILLPSSIRSAGESVADWLQNHWPLNESSTQEVAWPSLVEDSIRKNKHRLL